MHRTRLHSRSSGNLRSLLSDLAALDFGEPMVGAHRTAILRAVRELVLLIEGNSMRRQGHGRRTADLAHRIGLAVGLHADELMDLTLAALVHDIGLLTLPTHLLDETRELSAAEFALYQSHPRAGAELLEPISFLRRAALWIAHHHERWDGCGYPYGLRGTFIPLGARILAVADTFDAFLYPATSAVDTPPMSEPHTRISRTNGPDLATALGLLRIVAGSQLDPALVNRCTSIVSCLVVTGDIASAPNG
ncbi:MAG: HD domain-containing phosphohydrolase [Nitrospiraceae bacterium]